MILYTLIGRKFRAEGLERCSYSTGGGMLGGHRSVELKKDKDGTRTVVCRERETHADRERTTVYPADEAAFARAHELMRRYDLYAASKHRMSRLLILDGDTTTVNFDYENGDFSIRQLQRLSRKNRQGFRAVVDLLDSLLAGEGVSSLEPQEARLLLGGYTLRFQIEDAFDNRLNEILGEEHEVSRFEDVGIILCEGAAPYLSAATAIAPGSETGKDAAKVGVPGNIVYDPTGERIILLYGEYVFSDPVYFLAKLDGYAKSAAPKIAEMNGRYRMTLN